MILSDSILSSYPTTTELVASLANRQISSVELVEAAIARIEALDGAINAVVVRDFERARRAAKLADEALARGERRPLLGVPVTIKEQFDVAGLTTTWGDPVSKDWRPEADAVAVARLKQAGAIVLGKTNVPFRLNDTQSHNPLYGTTRNPWDLSRTPGGSSGGSAAALAAGYVSLELGTDKGGSVRFPAHCCGIYAHRPSLDVIPTRGTSPPGVSVRPRRAEPGLGHWAVVGPMARSAIDLSLALDVLAGPDELAEGIAYTLSLPPPRHRRLKDFRILLVVNHPLLPTSSAVRLACEKLAERLSQLGCNLSQSSDLLPDLAETSRTFFQFSQLDWIANQQDIEITKLKERVKSLRTDDESPEAQRLRGMPLDLRGWRETVQRGTRLHGDWRNLFRAFDVILCPVMPVPAYPHNHEVPRRPLDIDGQPYPYFEHGKWASIACLAGLPVTVTPIDLSAAGLPIGIQIIGPYLEDRTPLAFAEELEKEFGGFVPPPAPFSQ